MMATKRITVADCMETDLLVFSPALEINHAVAQLLHRGVSGAPVTDDAGRLVGMLTEKDCFKAALHGSYYQQWGGIVGDFMTPKVETMEPEVDIIAAAKHFLDSPYRRFPVVREGRLAGVVSRQDILRAFSQQW